MARVQRESFRLFRPAFADEFIRGESVQGLQPTAIIVCVDEVTQMTRQLLMVVIMEAFDGCFLDRPVHSLDLTICPRVLWLRQAMFNGVLTAPHVEHVCHVPGSRAILVTGWIRKLDPIVRENCMAFIGNRCDHRDKEG